MLTWDVIVLNGYLLINLHIAGYLIYTRFLGKTPNPKWYVPFVFISIVWAISIHTVTAFLYCGLGSRPFWNSALLAPRFIASAFISGPAFIIITLRIVRRLTRFRVPDGPIHTLTNILRVTVWINLFFLASELFVEFYTGGSHTASARYLYTGLHGKDALVPWIWTAIGLNTAAAIIILQPSIKRRPWMLDTVCLMTLTGVWIEKGMGLIVPGFIPSTLHELVEYMPSKTEWKITAGVWALGLMIYTVALKIALPVISGEVTIDRPQSLTGERD
jgi:molybdopterin-containing oxidoreductase family membrane subunit